MKKRLVTAVLCLGLSLINPTTANGGLESLTNDTHAIKSHTHGTVDVPYNMGKDYITTTNIPLVANLAIPLAGSKYSVKVEGTNKFFFYNEAGNSLFEIIEDTSTSNTFRKGVGITGRRESLGSSFKAYMVVNFKSNSVGTIDYNSRMYTILDSGVKTALARNLVCIPLVGYFIRRSFEDEQDTVQRMFNKVAKEVFNNPVESLDTLKNCTNVSFSEEEIGYVRKSLVENGFLKEK